MQETRTKDILGIFFGVTKMTILGWVLPPFSSLFPIQYFESIQTKLMLENFKSTLKQKVEKENTSRYFSKLCTKYFSILKGR